MLHVVRHPDRRIVLDYLDRCDPAEGDEAVEMHFSSVGAVVRVTRTYSLSEWDAAELFELAVR